MGMIKKLLKNRYLVIVGIFLVLGVSVFFLSEKEPNMDNFQAPGRDWSSPKKVEDYFVERLRMTPEEASGIRSKHGVDGMVNLRINDKTTLDALIGNLYYYGFVRDQDALRYALEHTKDSTPSNNAIVIDKNRTIDLNSEYRISENMDVWQIADILLNRPSGHFTFDEYNYFFMP
ncbi:hypothetical protein A2Z67_02135 [Candidatus Woesebacteria bacterium RBG_13_36_22]|uniref:Uncharacterized protein n=1 Tax=Candidatus Woesebacteria bacterium RBG_13_36_22 TaxID=1802478 RepID=A0A1F7X0I2_9BACT|nr:MAG: hypothetical protein A2Z67_02135 [Candidatus Woesebacteria bacterium RBG_13_36_22]